MKNYCWSCYQRKIVFHSTSNSSFTAIIAIVHYFIRSDTLLDEQNYNGVRLIDHELFDGRILLQLVRLLGL